MDARPSGDIIETVEATGELARARDAYARQAWRETYDALSAADRSAPLGGSDLELLSRSAYMLGREHEFREVLARAYRRHLEAEEPLAAVRCAFWIGMTLALQGERGRASGWLGRAERLLESEGTDCVERGYMLIARVDERETAGDLDGAAAAAAEAVAVGERFGDPDLVSLGSFLEGSALIAAGKLREGLGRSDLAMVSVLAGEVSSVSSGIVYCGVILACEEAHDLRRSREWTTAMTEWCAAQPDLVAFTGRCLVHRAQIMRMDGAWQAAIEEAHRAAERCLKGENPVVAGEAHYQRGEVHRLRGEHAAAEDAFREASGRAGSRSLGLPC